MADDKENIKRVEVELKLLFELIRSNPIFALIFSSRIRELLQTPGISADLVNQADQVMSEAKAKNFVNSGNYSGLDNLPYSAKQREALIGVAVALNEYKTAIGNLDELMTSVEGTITAKRKKYHEAHGTSQELEAKDDFLSTIFEVKQTLLEHRSMIKTKEVELRNRIGIAVKDPVLKDHLAGLRKELDELIKSSEKKFDGINEMIAKQIEHFIIEKAILDQNPGKSMDEKEKLIDEKVKEGLPRVIQSEIAKYVRRFEGNNDNDRRAKLDAFLDDMTKLQDGKYIIIDKDHVKPSHVEKAGPKKEGESMTDRIKRSRENNDLTPRQR